MTEYTLKWTILIQKERLCYDFCQTDISVMGRYCPRQTPLASPLVLEV